LTSFGDSIGNSLGADSGAGIGGGTGWPVPPWKFGVSAGAMMGRGGT
jgi:hypothetical protein